MDNLIIFTLHTFIAIFVIIPMFLVLLILKTMQFSYYTVAHTLLGFGETRKQVSQEI